MKNKFKTAGIFNILCGILGILAHLIIWTSMCMVNVYPKDIEAIVFFLIFTAVATGILGGWILFAPAFRMIHTGFQMYRGSPKEMVKRSKLNGTEYDRRIIVDNTFKIIGGGFGLWIVITMFINNYNDFMVAGIYYITFSVVIAISVFLDIRALRASRKELKKEGNNEE